MIILDSNVVSELMRPIPEPAVVAWLDAQNARDVWLSSVTLHEVHFGIKRLPIGPRRSALASRLHALLQTGLDARVLALDGASVQLSALVQAKAEKSVGHYDVPDCMIGGIAAAHGASVATRNIKDFQHFGIPIIDPWTFTI